MAHPKPRRLLQHRGTERDIRERQAAVPEQDGLALVLACRLEAGDDLAHLGVQRRLGQLDGAHRAVGHDEGPGLDPFRLQHRLRCGKTRGLDDDVGALDAGAPIGGRPHRLAEIAGEPLGEGVAALRPARMDADLSNPNRRSRRRTFQYAVPRAPTCPKTFASLRARYFAPIAVTAPVRISVRWLPSMIAFGTPLCGSIRSRSPISEGRPSR